MERKKPLTTEQIEESRKLKAIFNSKKKALKITQYTLAERFKVSQVAINHWLNGVNALNIQIATQFAEALQISVADFSQRLSNEINNIKSNHSQSRIHKIADIHRPVLWSSNTPLPEDDYVFTPFLKESEFTGGEGSFEIPDYNGFRLPFGKSTLYRKGIQPDKVFCCTLNGNSMEPRIAEDATIAVDTGIETIRDGKIYAFQHDDLFRVKYLYRLPGGKIRIHSANEEEYTDEIVNGEEIRLIGRVFWWSVLD